ncbi:L-asparagine permease [Serratia rubidaea]|nr:L-asparagine permease [Serratia rubidaea]
MMAFDYPNGTWTVATIPVLAILLLLGWFGLRKRAAEVRLEQQAHEQQSLK